MIYMCWPCSAVFNYRVGLHYSSEGEQWGRYNLPRLMVGWYIIKYGWYKHQLWLVDIMVGIIVYIKSQLMFFMPVPQPPSTRQVHSFRSWHSLPCTGLHGALGHNAGMASPRCGRWDEIILKCWQIWVKSHENAGKSNLFYMFWLLIQDAFGERSGLVETGMELEAQ